MEKIETQYSFTCSKTGLVLRATHIGNITEQQAVALEKALYAVLDNFFKGEPNER